MLDSYFNFTYESNLAERLKIRFNTIMDNLYTAIRSFPISCSYGGAFVRAKGVIRIHTFDRYTEWSKN